MISSLCSLGVAAAAVRMCTLGRHSAEEVSTSGRALLMSARLVLVGAAVQAGSRLRPPALPGPRSDGSRVWLS